VPDFEILSHTADTGFRAFGDTLEDLFLHAAEALIAAALDPSEATAYAPRQIQATGADLEELLVNWLNEVLYLLDGERFLPARFESLWFAECQATPRNGHDPERREGVQPESALPQRTVTAHLLGEHRDNSKHPPRIVAKAATFHQLRIGEHNGRWEAEVYLDI
jgi:SHS2 domain-containing protein